MIHFVNLYIYKHLEKTLKINILSNNNFVVFDAFEMPFFNEMPQKFDRKMPHKAAPKGQDLESDCSFILLI